MKTFIKKILLLSALQVFAVYCYSQTKIMEAWYDPYYKTRIAERYSVLSSNFDVKHGAYKSYSKEGAITAEGNYNNGNRTGKWTFRFDNNYVTSIENYNQNGDRDGAFVTFDIINMTGKSIEGTYSNGKKVGQWKEWWCVRDFPNVLKYEGSYKDGKAEGYWKFYYENAKLEKEGNCSEGKLNGEWKFYTQNGTLFKKGNFGNDLESGLFTFYDVNGTGEKITEGNYKDGYRIDSWTIYFDKDWKETFDSKQKAFFRKIKYANQGVPDGKVTDYYGTGEKQFEGYLVAGNQDILDGDCFFYYKNGNINSEGKYNKGKKIGLWKSYYESNKKLSETNYDNGEWTVWTENGNVSKKKTGGTEYYYDEKGGITKVITADGNQMDGGRIQKSEILQLLLYIRKGIPNDKPFTLTYEEISSYDDESQLFYTLNNKYSNDPNFSFKKELKTASDTYDKYNYESNRDTKYNLGKTITENLYRIANNSREINSKIIAVNESKKKVSELYTGDKPNKMLFEKSETLYQSLANSYTTAEDSDTRISILQQMQKLYDKMSELKSSDNTELNKQLKKAKTESEIKTSLGL